MFELVRPWCLALLPGLLVWWIWRFAWVHPALPQFLGSEETGGRGEKVPHFVPGYLRLGAMALLILALAGPRTRLARPLPPEEGLALMIALDLSGSMGLESPSGGSRLDMARNEIARFIRARPQDRIGLVTFGENALTRVPPTTNHQHLLEVLDDVRVRSLDEGTALGTGLGLAAHGTLNVATPSRVVILFTDGRSNAGTLEPLSAAEAAGILGIRIHAVGIGSADGEEPLDEPLLRAIVDAGDGRYLRSEDAAGLRSVLSAINELETGPVTERAGFTFESRHRGILWAAILLFLLEAVLWSLPRGRVS